MISGIPKTRDPWVLYYWFVNELRITGYDEDFILSVLAKPPYVPRATCSSCGQAVPSPKKKQTEVFEDVFFVKESTSGGERIYLYPYTVSESLNLERFLNKPPMKITLEWKE